MSNDYRDHPHSHGEYFVNGGIIMASYGITPTRMGNTLRRIAAVICGEGSPPLAWGIQESFHFHSLRHGITPTRMGNTGRLSQVQATKRDHPHSHGEYRIDVLAESIASRITPTRMGNTVSI